MVTMDQTEPGKQLFRIMMKLAMTMTTSCEDRALVVVHVKRRAEASLDEFLGGPLPNSVPSSRSTTGMRRFDSDNGPDSPRKPDDSDSDVSKSDEIDNVDDYLM